MEKNNANTMIMAPASPAVSVSAPDLKGQHSLYVGDLHHDLTLDHLQEAFKGFEGVASVYVCCDFFTGQSLGYGYVNFYTFDQALHAMTAMNNTPLNGKVIRVSWVDRDSDARKSGKGNVFVKNLSEHINNAALMDLFAEFGDIISCKVAAFGDGKSKGFGFVQFKFEESAKSAIQKLNGSIVYDKEIYVGNFLKKNIRPIAFTNVYIKNLVEDVTEDVLMEKFSEFGGITSLVIPKNETGDSKGFGFVNFKNAADAKRAVETMNGASLGSKVIYVARAQKKAERKEFLRRLFEEKRKEHILKYKGLNIYVKNIHDVVSDEELKELFSQCGTITSAKIMRDGKGIKRGFGFVCFSIPDEANNAVIRLHGFMFHGKPLYVAIAQRKEERQVFLQRQFMHCMATFAAGPPPPPIPGSLPPPYYTAPPGVVPHVPPRPVYQPLGVRPGWTPNLFALTSGPSIYPPQAPVIPYNQRQHRQRRERMNGHAQSGLQSVSYTQQPFQSMTYSKYQENQRAGQANYQPSASTPEFNGKPGAFSVASDNSGSAPQDTENLNSMLHAAATPADQKQILGERLYPLVCQHQPELASKITGMLLEMDNSELLVLLDSQHALATKVNEAVEVLNLSKRQDFDIGMHLPSSTQLQLPSTENQKI